MRVLFVTASSMAGGGPRHLLDWLAALRERKGHAVEIYLAAPPEGMFAEPLRAVARESLSLPEKRLSLLAIHRLVEFARKNRIEVVHSFGRAGGIYGRLLHLVGFEVFHSPQGLISPGLKQPIYDLAERLLRDLTHGYVFGSESEAKEGAARFGAARGGVLPPVVRAPAQAPVDRCSEALAAGRPIVIGTIGRFVNHKRVLELARAVLNMGPGFEVAFFGEGDNQAALEKLSKNSGGRVKIRGLVDRWEALAEIDVFASWSKSESFGLAVAEAMAFGTPCVLSDVPGHRDLAGDGARAWVFDPQSPVDFERAVKEVLGNAQERSRRVLQAREFIESTCGADRVAEQLIGLYASRQ